MTPSTNERRAKLLKAVDTMFGGSRHFRLREEVLSWLTLYFRDEDLALTDSTTLLVAFKACCRTGDDYPKAPKEADFALLDGAIRKLATGAPRVD